MNDLDAVHRTVADVAHHIDLKRWADLRVLFADETAIDYTSLFGGTPRRQTADALIDGWRAVLARVTTQHLLGPITVQLEGDRATARCHVRALHFARGLPGGWEWEVLGHYVFELKRRAAEFRIEGMTLRTLHQSGNLRFLEEATALDLPQATIGAQT